MMKNINPISPFVLFCQKVIPLAYDESMSYYECLCALVEHIKEMDNVVNNNSDAIKKLQEYVDNYFKNLDIQDEVNTKLDEMAESGELTDIIAQYLQLAGILAFNTLNDLKNAENLNNGSFTKIYGKVTYNDGYGAFYKIRQLINTDVIDNDNLVALTNYPTLVAEKIKNQELINTNNTINSVGLYKNKNMVVFGDSWTDPVNNNSLNGYWVNKVAMATGMTAFNYAKGAASFLRENNSYRMQLERALQMTQEEKTNTALIIVYACDTDILETNTADEYITEVEYILNTLHTNYPNAKIMFIGFTWRVNKLLNEYNQKMINYLFLIQRQCNNIPLTIAKYASYWVLGIPGYFQNQYHPNQFGYNVVAGHIINMIYGGTDEIRDSYNVNLNLDDQTDDRRCTVDVYQDKVEIQFHCVFSQALNNKHDWIAGFPRIAIPQPDVVFPICTAFGDVVGTFSISAANSGRAELYIKELPANTAIFVNGTYRAQANFEYSN